MPKKYCLGTGAIGETVTMGQKTTFYHHTSKKQLGTVNKVFLKFELVSYNKAQNSVTIRLLEIKP
jgi:hypothetical protein